MPPMRVLDIDLPFWAYAPSFLALWVLAGVGARAILFGRLHRVAAKTGSRLPELLMGALRIPLLLMIVVTGVLAMIRWTPAGEQLGARPYLTLVLRVTTILACAVVVERLLCGLIEAYGDRADFLRTAAGLLKGCVRALLIGLVALVLLDNLGVSITPVLASLGIGSLAVAFALQPTLENFFAGVQIVIDRPIQPGHFIRLESGEEGFVEKIGLRSTWIRMLPNNMIIIPNKLLVGSRVLNYNYPQKELAVTVEVGIHYGSNLAEVERVTVEVAEEIQRTAPGAVRGFQPLVRYHTFSGSSIDFTAVLRAEEFTAGGGVKHEFIKALQARYAKEGIVIPFPITAVNLAQEGAEAALKRG